MVLIDIFVDDNGDYRAIKLEVDQSEDAQVDSIIVTKYLGYMPSMDKDKELEHSLLKGTAKDVEKLLIEGANAFSQESTEVFKETILEYFWDCAFEYDSENPDWKDFLEKNTLLLNHGAMPRSTFNLFYNSYALEEQVRLKVFRMFFGKNVFMRHSFWDHVVFDAYNMGETDWLVYDKMAENGLWSYPPLYACHNKIKYCTPWHRHLEGKCKTFK